MCPAKFGYRLAGQAKYKAYSREIKLQNNPNFVFPYQWFSTRLGKLWSQPLETFSQYRLTNEKNLQQHRRLHEPDFCMTTVPSYFLQHLTWWLLVFEWIINLQTIMQPVLTVTFKIYSNIILRACLVYSFLNILIDYKVTVSFMPCTSLCPACKVKVDDF